MVYHYRVKSRNAAGILTVSGDFTFATVQNGSIPLDGLASLSYNGANNRIDTPGFEYDPAGNQTRAVIDASGTQQQYRYDCAGRLAQVLDGSGNVLATYSYGADNQRLMSVEGGVTKYFAWAGGNITSEYEAWGTNALIWKKSYVYLGGRLLATTSGIDGMETQFHHPDRLGTRLVTGAGGAVVTEQLGMPFGTMLPFTQTYGGENSYQHPTLSNPSKKRFTSYDRSDVTGLHYAVNRSYSSEQGRFTQVDPIGMEAASLDNPQTLNMYAYCGNDPINHVDPSGLLFGWLKSLFRAVLKIAAVIVTVAAVLATVWTANPFITIAAWKLWLGAGALWAAAYGKGKLSRILGGVAGFGSINAGSVLTPKTFPDQSGVGPLNGFLQAAQSDKNKDKGVPCGEPPWDDAIGENGIFNQLVKPLGIRHDWIQGQHVYTVTNEGSIIDFSFRLKANGWEPFITDPLPEHWGYWDFRKQYNGEWYHLSLGRPGWEEQRSGKRFNVGDPIRMTLHWEEAMPGGLTHFANWVSAHILFPLNGIRPKMREFRRCPPQGAGK
jgi:RHS repeat-associated protein